MADAVDPAELLGIHMDQFAGPLALVRYHRRLAVQGGQPSEPEAAQHRSDVERANSRRRVIAEPFMRSRRNRSIAVAARPAWSGAFGQAPSFCHDA